MLDFWGALGKALRRHGVAALFVVAVLWLIRWIIDQWAGNHVTDYIDSNIHIMWVWMSAHPMQSVVIVVALFVAFCSIIATRDELIRKYVEFAREPDMPNLEIIWKPTEKIYYHSYVLPNDPKVNLQFRVSVHNISKRKRVENIEVKLLELDPFNLSCVPCHLRLTNNVLPQQAPIHSFCLNAGDHRFVDVLIQWPKCAEFWFLHTTNEVSPKVSAQPYTFKISVSSQDGVIVSKRFGLSKNEPYPYWDMRELP